MARVASALFIAALVPLITISIALSLRDRPLLRLIRRYLPFLPASIDDTVVFLGILLLFDVVAVGLLVRFGTVLS
jgi:hypothetical protein